MELILMKMTFRWYGEGNDSISLEQIRQIPGVTGIVWSLHDMPAGEEWPMDRILKEKEIIEKHGFNIDVVESVNIHEDIKLGLPTREKYIENYKRTIEKLGKVGVKVICYNFMPVFDWTRSDLAKELPDGSTALFYEKEKVENADPMELVDKIAHGVKGYTMPGWEPERLSRIKELFKAYENVSEEDLWNNLKYFLEAIIPVCKANNVKMAIHPDDPAWPIFGLPRLIISKENVGRFLNLVDSPYNGLTFCSGSLGSNPKNDLVGIIKEFAPRIHFAHIRNIKHFENGDFIETSHKESDGSLDMVGMVTALHEAGFTGYARPDHGRHIWNEKCRPGYGLYDRALGIMYLWGIWDSLERNKERGVNANGKTKLK
jgi:mannonate dehydratase